MPSSAPSNTTSTTKSSPWGPEQGYILQGLQSAGNLYSSNPQGPSYYPGQTYAGLNGGENTALNSIYQTGLGGTNALNGAQRGVGYVGSGGAFGQAQNTFNGVQGSLQGLANGQGVGSGTLNSIQGLMNPASNPYLQQAEANTKASVLPGLQSGFNAGGRADSGDAAFGASQGLASAIGGLNYNQYNTGVQEAQQAAAQQQNSALSAAQLAGQNYNSGLSAINQAGAVAPGLNTSTLTGQQAAFGAGQAGQTDQQNQINAAMARYNYGQTQPYNALSLFENEVNGSGAQGGTSTTTQPYQTNQFANVGAGLSGLASIASIASSIPWSDRRLKEDIERVGTAKNGLAIYAYRLRGDPKTQIGFMADEVEKKHPEAVHMHPSGFKMVDYAQAVR